MTQFTAKEEAYAQLLARAQDELVIAIAAGKKAEETLSKVTSLKDLLISQLQEQLQAAEERLEHLDEEHQLALLQLSFKKGE